MSMPATIYRMEILQVFLLSLLVAIASADNFNNDIAITWGAGHVKVLEQGNFLQLGLDRSSGSGFMTKREYLFGRIDMDMKLVPDNSAGTVTTLYLSSLGPTHDEIDIEFLGNLTGEPYTLHTNVYSQGKGDREQQFYLWFDPRADFHTYSILWNPQQIIFYVDGTPIRVFKNSESSKGVAYPRSQPMRLYSSLWAAEDWATQGGRVKTDWKRAPFIASYRNFYVDACVWYSGRNTCSVSKGPWFDQTMDDIGAQKLRWVRKNYMIYNYCTDYKRFPQGLPSECSLEPAA